jgi:hypothetical protein
MFLMHSADVQNDGLLMDRRFVIFKTGVLLDRVNARPAQDRGNRSALAGGSVVAAAKLSMPATGPSPKAATQLRIWRRLHQACGIS